MDILKARQKAKAQKHKAADERAHEEALQQDIERAASDEKPAPPQAPPRPPPDERPARAPRIDPLREFLATYDDGDYDASSLASDDAEPVLEDERRFLSFDLAGEAYAASIMDVREILKVVALTEVPRAPREVLGVLSKRGVVMPVCDLAAILGLRTSSRALDRDQRVLVAGDGERICGLRVDRVRQVVRLAQRAIEEVPASLGTKNAHMLVGLGRARVEGGEQAQMLIILDIPAVLAHFSETMGIAPAKEAAP